MGFHGVRGPVASTEDFQAAYITAVWTRLPRIRMRPAVCSGRGPITTTAGTFKLWARLARLESSRSTASPSRAEGFVECIRPIRRTMTTSFHRAELRAGADADAKGVSKEYSPESTSNTALPLSVLTARTPSDCAAGC